MDINLSTKILFYTLLGTARLNAVDPERWLREVLSRIADYPSKTRGNLNAKVRAYSCLSPGLWNLRVEPECGGKQSAHAMCPFEPETRG
jgi:hypothetical protein